MRPIFAPIGIASLFFLALAACATAPTVYAPARDAKSAGYRETQIESDRFRVVFLGNPDLKGPGVEDLALRRAAELTTQTGADWFRVVSRTVELVSGRTNQGASFGVGGSTGSFGGGVGVGVGLDLSPDSRRYEASLEIQTGKGPKPGDGNVYDARSILSRPG